jgi:hypothetical protein
MTSLSVRGALSQRGGAICEGQCKPRDVVVIVVTLRSFNALFKP